MRLSSVAHAQHDFREHMANRLEPVLATDLTDAVSRRRDRRLTTFSSSGVTTRGLRYQSIMEYLSNPMKCKWRQRSALLVSAYEYYYCEPLVTLMSAFCLALRV